MSRDPNQPPTDQESFSKKTKLEEELFQTFEDKTINSSIVYFMEWFLDDQTKEWMLQLLIQSLIILFFACEWQFNSCVFFAF